jgi:hypothetical protein
MPYNTKNKLTPKNSNALLQILENRFVKNMYRHKGIIWEKVKEKLEAKPEKIWSLNEMENTGGEPDVVGYDKKRDEYIFMDCAAESPKGRRSFCYDKASLESRKEFKPKNSAMHCADEMGIEVLTEEEYRTLQMLHKEGEKLDTKTSSWLKTPTEIRKLGGAIFGDYRYGTIFIYHNGVESYYAGRGFRGVLKV